MMKRLLWLFAILLPGSILAQQVAVIGLNNFSFGGLRDGYAFVALEDIPDGTKVYFTEEDYDEPNNGFILPVVGESVIEWTASGTLSKGCVVVIHEVSANNGDIVASSMGCNAGSVTANFGSLSIGTNDPIYAFSSSGGATADAILANLTEIYGVMFIDNLALTAAQNPINDYPNAIVIDLNVDGGGAHFTPASRANPVSLADLASSANYSSNPDGIDPLDATIFANISDDPCAGIGDADMDGTCDDVDGCPNDPNKTEPGICGCGVVDDSTDSDMDGTPDCVDGCVNDPNKTEPGNCGCGNPEPGAACDDGDSCTINDMVQSDCSCSGTFSDPEAPMMICGVSPPPVAADANCMAQVGDLTVITMAVDDCDANPSLDQVPPAGSMVGLGSNNIVVIATDASGNQDSCTYTLTVEDMMPPTITCPDNIVISAEPGFCDTLITFTEPVGMSLCSQVGTAQVAGQPSGSFFLTGVNTLTFQSTAANGMTASCSFTITVEDIEPPVLNCTDITVVLDAQTGEAPFILSEVAFIADACIVDDLSAVISAPDVYTCDQLGVNTETIMVSDTSGNTANCSFDVTVEAGNFDCGPNNTDDLTQALGLAIYPNPAKDLIFIEVEQGGLRDLQFSLWDARGQALPLPGLNSQTNIWNMSIDHLPKGAYWLQIMDPFGSSTVKRIIVQ